MTPRNILDITNRNEFLEWLMANSVLGHNYSYSDDNFGLNNPNAVVMVKYMAGHGVIV